MARTKLTVSAQVDARELAAIIARGMSDTEILKLFKDVDKLIADWGFTRKVNNYFSAEMRKLAEAEGRDTGIVV